MKILLRNLAQWNPFDQWDLWPGVHSPLKVKEIEKAISQGRFEPSTDYPDTRKHHIERVAYLVLHPAKDPIDIDVGCPSFDNALTGSIVWDGHHRLAAAFYRGDESIEADVAGECAWAEELLGIKPEDWYTEEQYVVFGQEGAVSV